MLGRAEDGGGFFTETRIAVEFELVAEEIKEYMCRCLDCCVDGT